MKPTNYKNLALAGITAAVLTACSSGGTCGTCAIPVPATGSKLIFVAPSILPSLANTTGINYMGVYNPTTTAISNISYSLGQAVGTGSSVTLDPASAKICANIAAKSSCFLKLSVPESTIAGGAVVTASNSDGTEAATPLAIGVQQVPYGESANANGVGLYFYPKAQYSESGVPFMLATAVVQSPNVGNINSIEIVDESGNLIADQYVTSGNSGVGAAPLTMGSVVEIMLPLPKGVNLSQNYKVRTSYQSAPSTLSTIAEKLGLANKQTQATSNQTTGTQVYTVTTQGNNINLQFTPSQVYLTGKNPVQYGYLYNIGDLTASQIQVSSSSPNVRVTAADQILNGQRVIKVTYELINTTVAPASNTVTVTAKNPSGQTQTSTGGTNQNVSPDVVPTPSPTPTPTPGPAPAPAANLTLSTSIINLSPGLFYKTITVTNTGSASATNLILPTLPSSPLYLYSLDTCVAGQTLVAGASCSYSVAYAGSDSVGSVTGQFVYTGGGSPLDVTINWQPAQQYGYLAANSSAVYKCIFDGSDNISYCLSQGAGLENTVRSLAFTSAPNGTNYLYVTQSDQGVAKCSLDLNGDITSCDMSAGAALDNDSNFGEAIYLTFGVVNNIEYAYVSDSYDSLWSCTLQNNGDFDVCTQLDLSTTHGISFTSIGGVPYLYMAGEDNNSNSGVLRFALDSANGQIIGDSATVAGDAVYKNGGINILYFNGINYAYSGNDYSGGISCSLDSNGLYTSTCNTFGGYNTAGLPYNTTAILMQTGNTYAYFGGVNDPSSNGLYRCTINQGTGALNCSLNSAVGAYSITFGTYAATTPISITKHIFVTNGTWDGNLGGYSGADSLCQTAASEGSVTNPLGATWKALLWGNDSTTTGVGYRDTDGNFIAFATGVNLVGYTSSLFTPINYDQNGALISSNFDVWTGADWRDPLLNFSNCSVWTSSSSGDTGFVGLSNSTGSWAYDFNGNSRSCDQTKRLYCVQQ